MESEYSEDDIQPLIQYEGSRELYLELNTQLINADPEFEQVNNLVCIYLLACNYKLGDMILLARHQPILPLLALSRLIRNFKTT